MRERQRSIAGAAILVALAVIVYWPALRGEFVWDDRLLVAKNPLVTGELNPGSIWFRTDFPLSLLALWIQWLLWGAHPAGYHIVNVLLHAANALLFWSVLKRLRIPGAWFAAALFAVHPVAAASAAWISELKNTLSAAFCLLSLRWFLSSEPEQTRDPRPFNLWYWLSLTAFLFALASKTSTVILPVILIACIAWERRRLAMRDLWRTSPFFALALVFGAATVWFQAQVIALGDPVQSENFRGRLALAGRALWFYLGKAILPLNLNMIYPRWKLDHVTVLSFVPLLAWLIVLGLLWRFRRSGSLLFGLGCFIAALLPVLGFLSMDYLAISRVSDHFAYLAIMPIAAMAGAGLAWIQLEKLRCVIAAVLVIALSTLTLQRARVIATDETLWRDTLAKNPEAWTAHNNLGCELAARKEYSEALKCFDAALQLNPKSASAHCNRARVFAFQNRLPEAETEFKTALRLKPGDAEFEQTYAAVLADHGKPEEAIEHVEKALRIKADIESHLLLARLRYQRGDVQQAAEQYRLALNRNPDLVEALNNLAWIRSTSADRSVRDGVAAVQLAERACRLTGSTNAGMIGTLAAAYAEAGRFADAEASATKAADLATAAGDSRFAEMNRQLLQLYRSRRPYHEGGP